jgi:hypothetical protein
MKVSRSNPSKLPSPDIVSRGKPTPMSLLDLVPGRAAAGQVAHDLRIGVQLDFERFDVVN